MSIHEAAPWDTSSDAFRADPHPTFTRLRENAPLARFAAPNGYVAWVLTRHEDCALVLRDPRFTAVKFARGVLEKLAEQPDGPFAVVSRTVLGMMLVQDPPDHTRLRALVSKAFTPRSVAELRPRIQAVCDRLLDLAEARGELDAIADFGTPLPLVVIADLLGIPEDERAPLKGWSDELVTFLDGSIREKGLAGAARASLEMRDYMEKLFAERRARPRDDLVSRLVAASEAGDRLSQSELLATVILLLGAGHETTTNLIGNGLYTILRHPEEHARFVARPELDATVVDEVLRFEPPVTLTSRNAKERLELRGQTIPETEELVLVLAAANRDPAVFAEPDRLDLGRGDNRHLSFGFGPHFCLGAALARLEGQIAFGTLLRRFPGAKLAGETLRWRPGLVLRGLESLPIRL